TLARLRIRAALRAPQDERGAPSSLYAFEAVASASIRSRQEALRSSAMAASTIRWREPAPRRSAVMELNFLSTASGLTPWREKPGGSSTSARKLRPAGPGGRLGRGEAPRGRARGRASP